MNGKLKRPVRVESIQKRRGGVSIQIVNRDGTVILGGFGYFYEDTLRSIAACINAAPAHDQRLALSVLEWSDFAKTHRADTGQP